jgi:hypothetical protein
LNIIEHCRPWIEDALAYSGGTHTFEDVERRILESHLQLWPAERGCAVTEIVIYPRKKVLHVFLAGGEMDQIIDMIDSAVAWSKTQGCTSMTIAGTTRLEAGARKIWIQARADGLGKGV